jgi:hypothetical protein
MRRSRVLVASVLAVGMSSPILADAQFRLQEAVAAAIVYSGAWTEGSTVRAWSGGTAAFAWSGDATVTLTFSGTGVSWIGFRGPQTGIARVRVDGVQEAEVDTFAAAEELQAVLFTRTGLAPGPHTLTVEVTGTMNPASSNPIVVVDAFDVEGAPGGRIQETGPATITYTGHWHHGNTTRTFSGRTAAFSLEPAARASLSFTGTAVSWIGFRGPQTGIARVFVDGRQEAEVDTFAEAEEAQAVLFTRSGLAPGAHTLTVEVTGTRNPASSEPVVVVDAFDVTP